MKGGGRVGQQEKELKDTPQSGERKVFFLCNGNKAGCIKEFCFENGGVCLYTSDVMYAANFREGIGEGQYYEDSYKGKDIIQPFICRLQGTFGIPVITAYGVPYWQTGYMASGEYAQNR